MELKEKESYDAEEIIKCIKEIDLEYNSQTHDIDKLREINRKAKNKFVLETSTFELGTGLQRNSTYTPIELANESMLLSRLPFYKDLYINELMKKSNK